MHPLWAFVIGLAAGLGIGVVIMVLLRHVSNAPPPPVPAPLDTPVPPEVPDEVIRLVDVLHAAAIVIGPHDEVLCANDVAVHSALVQGSRVVPGPLLEMVRRTRHSGDLLKAELDVPRGRGHATVRYGVRVAELSDKLVIALAEDRTEARRVEEVRRDFVANVSHELKTPIGAIALLAETITDAADDPETVRKFAARMESESSRLSELVRQIIELSRLQADDPMTEGDIVRVDEVLAEVVDRASVDVAAREVDLRVAGDVGTVVYGHRTQLTGAVSNLVANAIAYSDRRAKVVVAAHHRPGDDPRLDITVTDNGIGIAVDEQQRIFERFYRVDYSRSRDAGGTGLGLAIVKHVVAAHGGVVEVWSRPGEGSTFTISIPDHPTLIRTADQAVTNPTPVAESDRTDNEQEVRL